MTKCGHHDIASIVGHYEACLAQFGDSAKGMDWPNTAALQRRYAVMTEVVRRPEGHIELLDLGCGSGMFLDYLQNEGLAPPWRYHGIDISEKMIEAAWANRGSEAFEVRDILNSPLPSGSFDYVVMNGLLTEKQSLSQLEMTAFACDIITSAFDIARVGIAFNVMSKIVDWEREDLFHWALEEMCEFVCTHLSRHFIVRNDYGLYEYTVYLYHAPIGDPA